jgi:hypothetical protein
VEFEGDLFTSDVFEEILALRSAGMIRLIDFLVIEKDQDGALWGTEISEPSGEEEITYGTLLGKLINMEELEGELADEIALALAISKSDNGLSPLDLNLIVHTIPPGTSAILGLVEHAWTRRLKDAVQAAGGVMLAQGLIEPAGLALAKTELDLVLEAAAVVEAAERIETQAALEAAEAVILSEMVKEAAVEEAVQALVTAKLIEEVAIAEATAVVAAALAVEDSALESEPKPSEEVEQ